MRLGILIFLCWLLGPPASQGSALPQTWPVVYSQVFRLEPEEIRQIPLTWEGIHARRFYLRLEASRHFEATLTRVADGSIVFAGHFEPRYGVLVPWGRDEYAHLTLRAQGPDGLQVTMTIATDPAEAGREIYGLQLNRFLAYYEAGEFEEAERALSRALVEDPDDEVAELLWQRLWEERGIGAVPSESPASEEPQFRELRLRERRALRLLEAQVEQMLATAETDSARRLLDAAPAFSGEEARTGELVLRARVLLAEKDYGNASRLLQDSLRNTGEVRNRFLIYRALAELNRELGNDHQLEQIVEQVLSETQDPQLRREAEAWRP